MVQRVVLGREDVRKLLRGRTRPASNKPALKLKPTVAFDSAPSQLATLVEIVAQDRPGLLYDLASTISATGCNIDVVLIDTEAQKAVDVFYVTANGQKLEGRTAGASCAQELLHVCGNSA